MTTCTDIHMGATCEEIETVLRVRVDQLKKARADAEAARADLQTLRSALAYRGTEAEEIDAALSALARVEAVAQDDVVAAETLRPVTPWQSAIHGGTMLRVLVELSRLDPDLIPTLRGQLLEVAATATEEEQ